MADKYNKNVKIYVDIWSSARSYFESAVPKDRVQISVVLFPVIFIYPLNLILFSVVQDLFFWT